MLNRLKYEGPARKAWASGLRVQPQTSSRFGRQSFLRRVGLGGAALLPAAHLFAKNDKDKGKDFTHGGLSRGDAAILRLLAAA